MMHSTHYLPTYFHVLTSSKTKTMLKAIKHNQLDEVRFLVENFHVDVTKPLPSSISYLHYASMFGTKETINYLIKQGADIDYTDSQGCTPLARAVHLNRIESVDVLLKAGASVDILDHSGKKDRTVTSYASDKHYEEVYTLLNNRRVGQK